MRTAVDLLRRLCAPLTASASSRPRATTTSTRSMAATRASAFWTRTGQYPGHQRPRRPRGTIRSRASSARRCIAAAMSARSAPCATFGFFRRPDQLHWESPFGADDALDARTFDIASADGRTVRRMIDASYLVEPVDGLWLLSIDANVFEPRDGDLDPDSRSQLHRQHRCRLELDAAPQAVRAWTGCAVAERAAPPSGKRLLAFSHYPVLDPSTARRPTRLAFSARPASSAARRPRDRAAPPRSPGSRCTSAATCTSTTPPCCARVTRFLVNIVRPIDGRISSRLQDRGIRGRQPACRDGGSAGGPRPRSRLRRLPRRDRWRRPEHAALLAASSHGDFLSRHLAEIVRHRYLPREWPADLAEMARTLDLADLHGLAA